MSNLQDTIVLDPRRFDPNTHKWNVPILTMKGLKALNLFIEGKLIDHGDYSIANNLISLTGAIEINEDTNARLVVEYNPTNILVKFWVPIIVAVITLIGAIGQPLLYNIGVIYQPDLSIEKTAWGYDFERHQFIMDLRVKHLKNSDQERWQIYVGARKRDLSVDVQRYTYEFFSGPFNLSESMELVVPITLAFSCEVARERAAVQGAVFLIERGISVALPFSAEKYSKGKVRFVTSGSETIPEGLALPTECD